ncbi:helicase, predicted [Enterocytozoon bieneusi H348]|nr:helicase, predicted [Enterocytozoon bieneusi H348]|eukprot:XP_002651395.1 helicase, predicted [Enterocytozoon bieneusi H348]
MSPRCLILCLTSLVVLAGCSTSRGPQQPARSEAEVKAEIVRLLPAKVPDRNGWAQDIYTAFDTQKIYPSTENICAVLAVTEQESTYQVDPPVPNMGKIAQDEILRRAAKVHVPAFVVRNALQLRSPTGQSYADRLKAARTEKD